MFLLHFYRGARLLERKNWAHRGCHRKAFRSNIRLQTAAGLSPAHGNKICRYAAANLPAQVETLPIITKIYSYICFMSTQTRDFGIKKATWIRRSAQVAWIMLAKIETAGAIARRFKHRSLQLYFMVYVFHAVSTA